jgi:hypothetical protein
VIFPGTGPFVTTKEGWLPSSFAETKIDVIPNRAKSPERSRREPAFPSSCNSRRAPADKIKTRETKHEENPRPLGGAALSMALIFPKLPKSTRLDFTASEGFSGPIVLWRPRPPSPMIDPSLGGPQT